MVYDNYYDHNCGKAATEPDLIILGEVIMYQHSRLCNYTHPLYAPTMLQQ